MSSTKSSKDIDNTKRIGKWYFGGLASAGAASCTHPLDLVKVHLQTASVAPVAGKTQAKPGFVHVTLNIVKHQGIFALYNGLSAALLRQLTYSTTRFGIYETGKKEIIKRNQNAGEPGTFHIPFYQRVSLAAVSGAAGGLVGAPVDMINVRMQNDIKLAEADRRKYKHAIDGLIQVCKREGVKSMFNGASMATVRAVLMTVGQLSFYDQFKYLLLTYGAGIFEDNSLTHFTGSLLSGAVATTLTQPLDVMKTRLMNASPGEFKSVAHCAKLVISESGPLGFFKGYIPAFVRLGPQTILTFIFFEQLRLRFGMLQI